MSRKPDNESDFRFRQKPRDMRLSFFFTAHAIAIAKKVNVPPGP